MAAHPRDHTSGAKMKQGIPMLKRLRVLVLLGCPLGMLQAELLDIDSNWVDAVGKPGGPPTVVYFVTHDCPISNRLLPEVRRICDEYAVQEIRCLLAYVDPTLTAEAIREHQETYGTAQPAVLDLGHRLVKLTGATVTPEVALFDRSGDLAYRGRINNLYARLGTPRRRPTEHDLREALDAVLAGRQVSRPRTQAVGCFIPELRHERED